MIYIEDYLYNTSNTMVLKIPKPPLYGGFHILPDKFVFGKTILKIEFKFDTKIETELLAYHALVK